MWHVTEILSQEVPILLADLVLVQWLWVSPLLYFAPPEWAAGSVYCFTDIRDPLGWDSSPAKKG